MISVTRIAFTVLLLGSGLVSARECWDTGCQSNDWAVVGCGQYNMEEVGKRPCPGGNIYSCCAHEGGGGGGDDGGPATGITSTQFRQAVTSNGYPDPGDAKYRAFMAGLPKGLITSKQEAAMALANFLQESDGLRAKREYACEHTGCPGSYEQPGCDAPGQDYYGRGYIQLSWCEWNYKPASLDLFGDDRLVRDPDMVARDEQIAWDTAFWFWKVNVHSAWGVQDGLFGATTNAINGALECRGGHLEQARRRYAMYGQVRAAFGLQGAGNERGCYN